MNKSTQLFLSVALILLISSCGIIKHKREVVLSDSQKLDNTALFVSGCKEKILGNYDKAISLFQSCIKTDPSHAASFYEIAGISYMQKRSKAALPFIVKAVSLEPENVWYQLLYANMLIDCLRYKEATAIYEKLAKKYPENLEYYYNWASGCLYMGKYTDAIEVYNLMEKKTGIDPDISIQKERIYLQLKKTDKAIDELTRLINAFPEEVEYYGILADLYLSNKMESKAFEVFKKIIELDPGNANVHLSLADYYREKREYEKSFDELKMAFSNVNLDIDTKVKIMLQYYTLTEESKELLDQAYSLLAIMLEVNPDEAKTHSIYADFLYRDNKLKEAKDEYVKVVSLDSSKYVIWEKLLLIESKLKDYSGMATDSKRAIELFPEQVGLYLFNGGANYFLKKYDEAIAILNKGIALVVFDDSLLEQFYTYLGNAYYAQQRYKEAFSAFDKILAINPKNAYILNNYSYYLSLRSEDLDKAEKMAKKAVEAYPNSPSYLDTYGWVLYKLGRYEEAELWINKAMNNGGNTNATILEHYGDIQFKLGNADKALEYWKSAKEKGEGSEFLDKKIKDKKFYE